MVKPRPLVPWFANFPIVFIDPKEDGLAASLDRKFQGIKSVVFENWEDFYRILEPPKDAAPAQSGRTIPAGVKAIFVHHAFAGEKPVEKWTKIKELLKARGSEPKFFLISSEDYSDNQEREFSEVFTDIFYRPTDRLHVGESLYHHFPGLQTKDDPINIKWIALREKVKSAGPVKVVEFSEAGFVIEYYRPITVGSFREIIPWQPYEVGAPELIASCNYSEEFKGKKNTFLNHFVLFGMTDFFLKSIRIWIRNNYISSKENS
jgi:hypothetical protein